jgi:hypothetical protein
MIKYFNADSLLENAAGAGLNINGVLVKNNKIAYSGLPVGTTASTIAAGDDSRFTNSRTPTNHASTHATGGTDVIPSVIAGGAAGLMTGVDKTKLDGIADGANLYVHPNHTGDVTSAADGATTIADHAVTLAKMADMATASLIGRNTAAAGSPEVLSMTTVKTMLGNSSSTWTPTIYATTTNPTITYTTRIGNYTVVLGALVFFNIYISIQAVTSAGSGNIRVNLPAGLIPLYNTVGSFIYSNYDRATSTAELVPQVNTAGYVYITENLDNGANANSIVTRIRAGTVMHITGTYAI